MQQATGQEAAKNCGGGVSILYWRCSSLYATIVAVGTTANFNSLLEMPVVPVDVYAECLRDIIVSILYWRCIFEVPSDQRVVYVSFVVSILYWRCRPVFIHLGAPVQPFEFQFSIGDAEGGFVNAELASAGFQFSIGDARNCALHRGARFNSLLEMPPTPSAPRRIRRGGTFQFSIGDALSPLYVARLVLSATQCVSILYWRCIARMCRRVSSGLSVKNASFNSLLEMQRRAAICPQSGYRNGFNSLLEMRGRALPQRRAGRALRPPFQFSIGDATRAAWRAPWLDTAPAVSILYWRCTSATSLRGRCNACCFNSLLEMLDQSRNYYVRVCRTQ
jgi:hypothetical protein